MRLSLKLLIGIPLLAVALLFGGSWVYVNLISSDAPAKLTVDSTATGDASTTTVADDGTTDGTWKATSASVAGYRVKEQLRGASKEAAGRTNDVTGSMALSGATVTAANFTVDMTTITSDESMRDGQFHGRIMNTSQFPTSTFKLASAIDLGTVPAIDETVTKKATGDLTLHGVTKRITFEVTAKRVTGEIRVNAAIPIHFPDYNIANPSSFIATVGDDGTLEFTLVLHK